MEEIIIYHNPNCTKSRETLKLLEGHNPTVVEYLTNPLTREELVEILVKLNMEAKDIARNGCDNNEKCLDLMVKYPSLIQRPIVVKGDRAIIGRPPENVLELL